MATLAAKAAGVEFAPIRHSEETVLYRVVREHLPSFVARAELGGRLPRFVERGFEGFLACGIPSHGFIRGRCPACRLDGLSAE